ncbi:Asp-tRNA(Asn)/Glu-tRNA(Gln) amidotransferase subunit GatA [Candidatus Magnetaquicoccus inordinatus]|uniref:Asp-tRNA(Asn)/Glu-tRNA(Gln) amidotransferase subunit GatA n=1 Tax=Candidatus Magnetaquicoccus inordinatus TaxID=2496818 RepID=UPI00102BB3FA|nr:Asp-tRNA(Asn)/Glu-tRNA(Gln) amidotransferase subunit GatA [Candidatus Magnetaquicoccus inordinatus]
MDLARITLKQAADLLHRRALSAVELTQFFLERINAHNPTLNAYITVDAEGALADARQADACLARGEATPLTGIPLAVKDLFCTKGLRTTCASRMLADFIPPYESTVTRRLREAGMVVLGKTNMDEFAMGSSNETSYFGPVKNPWDHSRIPGGSSGGSAAAVAAGLCVAALGTDTGGSIRQPAALSGITGLKPTYGRVSRYGMIAFASSLDQAGPMTRSVEDAALLLQGMAGHDPLDSTSIDQAVEEYVEQLSGGVSAQERMRGLRIGIPKEYFTDGLSESVHKALQEAIERFQELGAQCQSVSLPTTAYAIPTYYIIAPAEASSNLARYDGIRFGYRCEQPEDLLDMFARSRSEGFGAEVKRRIMLGTYVLSSGYYDAYYRQAQKVRRLIADDFHNAFTQVDLLLTPTAPETAFRIGEKKEDPVKMYLSDIFTINVNLAGLPALSLPCGFDAQNLPIGMQLIGRPLQESSLLRVGHSFQQVTDWHQRSPL